MALSGKDFQVLDTIAVQKITSQRQISRKTGISLGQVNYLIKRLLEKGLIKIGNFKRNPSKIGYAYLLTPKGIEAKSRLAVRFALAKLREYHELRGRIAGRLSMIEGGGHTRVVFLGPGPIKDLLLSIIDDAGMDMHLVRHCATVDELKKEIPDTFDAALFFDENVGRAGELSRKLDIEREKLIPLW